MTPKRILIIGRSPLVLENAVKMLRERGYTAEATADFDDTILVRYDVDKVNVVVFGGQVPPERKTVLRKLIADRNENISFVQGWFGIPGLIAEQVEEALRTVGPSDGQLPLYDSKARAITVSLDKPAKVEITAWWGVAFVPPNPTSTSRVLLDAHLEPGEHTISVPRDIPDKFAFASMHIGDSVHTLSLEK